MRINSEPATKCSIRPPVNENRGQLAKSFSSMGELLSLTEKLTSELGHKLEPALRPSPEKERGPADASPSQPLAPVAEVCQEFINRIEVINSALTQLLDTLEL